MVRRLGLGKNNHLTYASLALNPRYILREMVKLSKFSASFDKEDSFCDPVCLPVHQTPSENVIMSTLKRGTQKE